MKNFFRKTILLLTLAGIVFLGGGVGVARAETKADATQQPDTTKVDTVRGATTAENVAARAGQNTTALDLIDCGGFWDKLSLGCIMPVLTYTLYVATDGVLMLSGYIFDSILELSINKNFITKPFVDTIWVVMRDFSSMMFIFILLYTGIRTMLFGDDWKKQVMMVVVIALLINFSLFFTKIVIDAGNVLAMGVYSGLGVTKDTPVSVVFSNVLKPQQYFEFSAKQKDLAPTIFIIAGVVAGFLAFVLFKAALLFMGRLLAFWFLMAFSPFAFILLAFPQLATKIKFSFSAWLDMLINQAFVAPVFLFFIYIIITIIQSGFFKSFGTPSDAGAFIDLIFIPVISTAMIIYALKKALGIAESMSGEFGKIGASIGNKALGLAAAGTGVGLTTGVGAVAGAALRSETLKGMLGSDNWAMKRIGAVAETGLKAAHEKPMDFRNISIGGKKLGEHLGIESFGLKKGYKQLKEEKTEEIKGRGGTASEARIAAQTTRDDAAKAAKDARTDAETKAEVSKGATQTPAGRSAKVRKDSERTYASTPQGLATAINRAGEYEEEKETERQEKKASVDISTPANGIPGTPGYTPAKKSLNEKLTDLKTKHASLTVTDTGGTLAHIGGPNPGIAGTLKFIADQADTEVEAARAALAQNPLDPAVTKRHSLAKTAKNTADKDLKDQKEGLDNIEKLEKKIGEYKAL